MMHSALYGFEGTSSASKLYVGVYLNNALPPISSAAMHKMVYIPMRMSMGGGEPIMRRTRSLRSSIGAGCCSMLFLRTKFELISD